MIGLKWAALTLGSLLCLALANGHAGRLIGSIRRDCLDHVVVFGEAHLCRVLKAYASYYNRDSYHCRPQKLNDPHAARARRLYS